MSKNVCRCCLERDPITEKELLLTENRGVVFTIGFSSTVKQIKESGKHGLKLKPFLLKIKIFIITSNGKIAYVVGVDNYFF
ncbi:MAG: hypothetical protein ACJA0Q_001618 [Saprospiraceae bacterium]|jgi:hypothetical protein